MTPIGARISAKRKPTPKNKALKADKIGRVPLKAHQNPESVEMNGKHLHKNKVAKSPLPKSIDLDRDRVTEQRMRILRVQT